MNLGSFNLWIMYNNSRIINSFWNRKKPLNSWNYQLNLWNLWNIWTVEVSKLWDIWIMDDNYNVSPPRYVSWFITPITMVYGSYNYSYWGFCSPPFTSQRGASHCIDNIWKTMGETLETCSRNDWVLDIYLLEGVREPFQDFRSFRLTLRFPGSKSCFSYVGRSWNTGSILNSRNIWGFHGIS
jgi:hypothetical protein